MGLSRLLSAVCLAVLCCRCGSAPAVAEYPLAPGDQVEIVYRQEGAVSLELRNASSVARADAYSQGSAGTLKVAEDGDMRQLLAGLSHLGFFERAVGSVEARAKATLQVRINDRTWVRSRLPAAQSSVQDIQHFQDCVALFSYVYNGTTAYHSAAGVRTKGLYEEKHRRQQAANGARSRQ